MVVRNITVTWLQVWCWYIYNDERYNNVLNICLKKSHGGFFVRFHESEWYNSYKKYAVL